MRPFDQRLKEAAAYAGVEYSCTAIGRALGVSKQTVYMWMSGSEPKAAMIFHIADSWNVDARWLATDEGNMAPPSSGPRLSPEELVLLKRYRRAEPRTRASIVAVTKSLLKLTLGVTFVTFGTLGFNNNSFAVNCGLEPKEIHIVRQWLFRLLAAVKTVRERTSAAAQNYRCLITI